MGFWALVYLPPAFLSLVLGLVSRRWKLAVAGIIIALSWVIVNVIVMSRMPDRAFLAYFVADGIFFEIALFMLLHRFSLWNLFFLGASACHLMLHLAYWSYLPPPRRYHEAVNAFYIVQMAAVCIASRIREKQILPSDGWLRPRPVFAAEPSVVREYRPRTVPGQPRACPLQLRMWA